MNKMVKSYKICCILFSYIVIMSYNSYLTRNELTILEAKEKKGVLKNKIHTERSDKTS